MHHHSHQPLSPVMVPVKDHSILTPARCPREMVQGGHQHGELGAAFLLLAISLDGYRD